MTRTYNTVLAAYVLAGLIFIVLFCVTLAGPYSSSPVAHASSQTCVTRTAWAGTETSVQHDDGTFVTIPVRQSIILTHVSISVSYAQRGTTQASDRSELLVLFGSSDQKLSMHDPLLPNMSDDPAFSPLRVSTTGGASHNENPTLTDGVLAARILKSSSADDAASAVIDSDLDQPVSAGGVLWLRYDSVSAQPLDPEAQIVVTYKDAGC